MKVCRKCGEARPLPLLSRTKRTKDGLQVWCKPCTKNYAVANAERISARKKETAALDPEGLKVRRAAYYSANKLKVDAANKGYYEANRERVAEYKRAWQEGRKPTKSAADAARYAAAPEFHRSRTRAYALADPEKVKARNKLYRETNSLELNKRVRARYARCSRAKANGLLRSMLKRLLRCVSQQKLDGTSMLLGYSCVELIQRMEVQFQPGMSWNNHGEWHVDHKIPLAHFVKRGETRPHIVNALCNLQPLWAEQNLKKGKTFERSTR